MQFLKKFPDIYKVLDHFLSLTEAVTDFSNWKDGEKTSYEDGKHCIKHKKKDGKLEKYDCDKEKYYVCKIENVNCDDVVIQDGMMEVECEVFN